MSPKHRKRHLELAKLFFAARDKVLTQEEVAARTGLTQVVVSKIERGELIPNGFDMLRMAKVLGIPFDVIVAMAEDPSLADPPNDRPTRLKGPPKGAPRQRDRS